MPRFLFVGAVLVSLVLAREATAKELLPQIESADPLVATAAVPGAHNSSCDGRFLPCARLIGSPLSWNHDDMQPQSNAAAAPQAAVLVPVLATLCSQFCGEIINYFRNRGRPTATSDPPGSNVQTIIYNITYNINHYHADSYLEDNDGDGQGDDEQIHDSLDAAQLRAWLAWDVGQEDQWMRDHLDNR